MTKSRFHYFQGPKLKNPWFLTFLDCNWALLFRKYARINNFRVYNSLKNAAVQITINEPFLPVIPLQPETESLVDYIFEPGQEEILKELIPSSLKIQLYKALLDSFASEHGARMTAMHKATDNANEMKNDLKLFYNKARQAAITNEILEIVAGAEALGG